MGIRTKVLGCGPLEENTYLLTDEETGDAAVLDPGFFSKKTAEAIRESGRLLCIILTHAHGDHFAALREYQSFFPEAKVIAPLGEERILAEGDARNGFTFAEGVKPPIEAELVHEGDTFTLGKSILHFLETPGHTSGAMCIYADPSLWSGDTLFFHSVGRTDLPGGSWQALQRSVRTKLYTLPEETVVYPGHGPMTTIAEEKRSNPFV